MEIETKTEELQNTNVEEKTSTVETTTTENVVEEPKPIKYFKSFEKEEDWTSYHDSIVNKANTELLKEFGVSSTKELKAKLEAYETSSASMKAELEQIKQEKALINVDDEYKEYAMNIATAQMNKNKDLTLEKAIETILDKNPGWRVATKPIKLGTDKNSDKQATTKSGVMEEFLRRNPKIKSQL